MLASDRKVHGLATEQQSNRATEQQSNTILPAIIHPLCVYARPRARVFVCMVSFAGGVNQVQKHVRQLVECAHGARSEELLLHAALATKRAHTAFVPWLTVDGAAVVCCPLPCVRPPQMRACACMYIACI